MTDQLNDFGEDWASFYDLIEGDVPDNAIASLRDLSNCGRALELGIGTARYARRLWEEGIAVDGVDRSQIMISQARERLSGYAANLMTLDFSEDLPDLQKYSMVYIANNTFGHLLNTDQQVRCFRNAFRLLDQGGVFIVEVRMPRVIAHRSVFNDLLLSRGSFALHRFCDVDCVNQIFHSRFVMMDEDFISTRSLRLRYSHPSEIDLLSLMSGFRIEHRWSNWERLDYDASTDCHISVLRRR